MTRAIQGRVRRHGRQVRRAFCPVMVARVPFYPRAVVSGAARGALSDGGYRAHTAATTEPQSQGTRGATVPGLGLFSTDVAPCVGAILSRDRRTLRLWASRHAAPQPGRLTTGTTLCQTFVACSPAVHPTRVGPLEASTEKRQILWQEGPPCPRCLAERSPRPSTFCNTRASIPMGRWTSPRGSSGRRSPRSAVGDAWGSTPLSRSHCGGSGAQGAYVLASCSSCPRTGGMLCVTTAHGIRIALSSRGS
jgi:hypothetical protein